ncbi:MAG: helix-turn-helix transcriptional regulator [Deltaproteobacteria bacterium]|nr:helix-turn-helix transcriptional regulator [Deltaproteobacteria bacterium]
MMDSIGWHIEENYMKDFSLESLARRLGMNKFNFCRSFKERFGRGFVSYLNSIRVKNAAELLENPNLNITEIAYVVGYKSFTQFERAFKKIYNIPPREYRKRISKKL